MRTIKKCVFSSTLAGNSFAASPFLSSLLVLVLLLFLLLELHLLLHLHLHAHLANIRLSARPAYYAHAERDATHSICAFPASAPYTPRPHAPAPPVFGGRLILRTTFCLLASCRAWRRRDWKYFPVCAGPHVNKTQSPENNNNQIGLMEPQFHCIPPCPLSPS